ncbi:Toxin-antitoxin system, toxin component, RelE/ParE-like [Desulfonema limicola]|uniref:Toxin-antitoxin system, toxin component, RelE/ParE-like n=1 Tax=Desulfonema limicola TaxID=45656 RepID=A0A975B7M5_9BACT|nr:type II toxin-antitoxin system RelE/ParE family toxin [Desulfonema limicola]QTA80207.1 Toxin-antitoxin system, toxin component, RelE/ParE-like [Desulfonema limicola]
MQYTVKLKPQAIKDCKKIPKLFLKQIFEKIDAMQNDLTGNIKKLTNFTPEYRLKIGNYRVLFEIENNIIFIYRIIHRKDAYKL